MSGFSWMISSSKIIRHFLSRLYPHIISSKSRFINLFVALKLNRNIIVMTNKMRLSHLIISIFHVKIIYFNKNSRSVFFEKYVKNIVCTNVNQIFRDLQLLNQDNSDEKLTLIFINAKFIGFGDLDRHPTWIIENLLEINRTYKFVVALNHSLKFDGNQSYFEKISINFLLKIKQNFQKNVLVISNWIFIE